MEIFWFGSWVVGKDKDLVGKFDFVKGQIDQIIVVVWCIFLELCFLVFDDFGFVVVVSWYVDQVVEWIGLLIVFILVEVELL